MRLGPLPGTIKRLSCFSWSLCETLTEMLPDAHTTSPVNVTSVGSSVGPRAWRIMLIFLILCYASNAHLLNIYASRIYYYAQYYAHSGS